MEYEESISRNGEEQEQEEEEVKKQSNNNNKRSYDDDDDDNNNNNNNSSNGNHKSIITNNNNNSNSSSSNKRMKIMSSATNNNNKDNVSTTWGNWMGSWKVGSDIDHEAERIDRQKAAYGSDTVSRLKDLNVLILGLQGVGVETAKNLILSNVGSVMIYDPNPCTAADRGTNFYISDHDVTTTTTRAQASLSELKSLNPFCRVDIIDTIDDFDTVITNTNVLGTGKPYCAIVVTSLSIMSGTKLYQLNEIARNNNIAFILAANHGVTSTIFSDYGNYHEILDTTGEPTQTLAISNIEVLNVTPELLKISGIPSSGQKKVVIVTVAQAEHGLDDNDVVTFDDMRDGQLSNLNGKSVHVKRVAILSPTDAKVDANGVVFKEALKLPTSKVVSNFERQYDFYKSKYDSESEGDNKKSKKFQVRTITMFNRLALILDDDFLTKTGLDTNLSDFESYQSGGLLNQVRPTVVQKYRSLSQTLESTPVPQMLRGEEWENGKGIDVHLAIEAVLEFHNTIGNGQQWPRIHNQDDAKKVVEIAQSISDKRQKQQQQQQQGDGSGTSYCWAQSVSFGFPTGEPRKGEQKNDGESGGSSSSSSGTVDSVMIHRFARLFQTEMTGFCAFLGGAAAQEVLKASGKFTPINQWIHHDEPCLVNDECSSNIGPLFGSRYDYQIAILGKDFQAKVANQRIFLVGCGALGCEYLKGLALMGVGTGDDGKVWVTDMDRIEVSNLSRQFLFRQNDVGSPKSVSGARVVKNWNPQMNIEALERRVGTDTEDFFNDHFWESLDVCWNALDNVMARQYTDSRCLFYSKPLLESGTLGTKCNSEVVLPFRTSTYNDGKESDENENQIAMCTLRSFPYLPMHCIEYAKQSYFTDYFEFGPDEYETFRKDTTTYFEQLDSMEAGEQHKSLTMIKFFIELQNDEAKGGKIDFESCLRVAFNRMMEDFRTSILNLCHSADEMEKSEGKKFWTGTKRRPRPIDWTTAKETPELMEYLYCTANIYASVWGVENVRDRVEFEKIVHSVGLQQPEWTPSSEKVNLNDDEGDAAAADDDDGVGGGGGGEEVEKLKAELYKIDVSGLQPAYPQDFEKDDDLNFHVDFLTISTNLRSWNYDIKASPRHTVKITAGRIIPALATTTAMVCGLVDIEFCKLVLGLQSQGRDKFLNCNINLAAGSGNFTTFSPDPPIPISTGLKAPLPETFTSWDKIDIVSGSSAKEEMTVQQLVQYIERSFGVVVDRIFEFGNTEDKAIYKAIDKQKLEWTIHISDNDDGKVVVDISDGVYTQWPNMRMASTMLRRLPPTSGQRKIFLTQVETVKKSLDQVKKSFQETFHGPVSNAYRMAYRPPEGNGGNDDQKEKQDYFDTLFQTRDYVNLGVHCHTTNTEEDITLPHIKFVLFPKKLKK